MGRQQFLLIFGQALTPKGMKPWCVLEQYASDVALEQWFNQFAAVPEPGVFYGTNHREVKPPRGWMSMKMREAKVSGNRDMCLMQLCA
jgi:hypothetical protein